jgi:hypothetical protein
MERLKELIIEAHNTKEFHRNQYRNGVRGACIEAAACAIREQALIDALSCFEQKKE